MVGDTIVSGAPPEGAEEAGRQGGADTAKPEPRAELHVGDVLRDTYRIIALLASGGSGNVFLAAHERIPGRVAVKTLRGERIKDAQSLARFRVEAQITAGLRHPHIVQTLDFDVTAEGVPYLVMELVEGGDLRTLVTQGPCPLPRVAHIIRQVASALERAHAMGIVHRDLKPANIMLVNTPGEPDFVKIVDFGLSKLLAAEGPPVTRPDQILGTPGYMAPEQIRGRDIDERIDQFALASLTYELLAGRPPFPGEDLATVLHAIMAEEPPRLSELLGWPCDALSAVIARALAKEPEARWPSIAEFDRALAAAVAKDGVRAPGNAPVLPEGLGATLVDDCNADIPSVIVSDDGTFTKAAPASSAAPSRATVEGELENLEKVGENYRW